MIQGGARLYCRIARGLGDIDLAIFRKSATDPEEKMIFVTTCKHPELHRGGRQAWETYRATSFSFGKQSWPTTRTFYM